MWVLQELEKLRAVFPTASATTLLVIGLVAAWPFALLFFRQQLDYRGDLIADLRASLKALIDRNISPEEAGAVLKRTERKQGRWLRVFGIIVVPLVAIGTMAYVKLELARVERDNFPYIKANIAEPSKPDSRITLSLAVLGDGGAPAAAMWISPGEAQRDAKNPAYWSMFGIYPPFVTPGGADLGVGVKPGSYWVEVDTQYGHIIEQLRIIEFQGKLIQLIDITNKGQTVLSSPRPEGFAEPRPN